MKPKRIRLSRSKGWRKPPNTVVVARPSRWGNPFRIDRAHDRALCVASFGDWVRSTAAGRRMAKEARVALAGRNLACWCPLDGPCHADILLKIANRK